jgi:MFS family permease
MLAALLVGGVLSDKFGRRNIWYGSCIIILVATWIMIFPRTFVVFIVCRIFIGIGTGMHLSGNLKLKVQNITCFKLKHKNDFNMQ